MQTPKLKAQPRSTRGSRSMHKLRGEGQIPAVLYGRGEEVVSLTLAAKDMKEILKSHTRAVTLSIGGKEEAALLQEVQTHPVRGEILHIDFTRIALDTAVHVKVPVILKGIPVGVATGGGVLDQQVHEVEIECLPTRIPEQITVKIEHLEIGKTLHAESLPLPEGVKLLVEKERAIATVHPPKQVVEEAAPAAEVAMQPEVIGQKEREERAKEKDKKGGKEEEGGGKEKEPLGEKKAEKK